MQISYLLVDQARLAKKALSFSNTNRPTGTPVGLFFSIGSKPCSCRIQDCFFIRHRGTKLVLVPTATLPLYCGIGDPVSRGFDLKAAGGLQSFFSSFLSYKISQQRVLLGCCPWPTGIKQHLFCKSRFDWAGLLASMFRQARSVSHSSPISPRTAELHAGKNSTQPATRIAVPFIQGGALGYQLPSPDHASRPKHSTPSQGQPWSPSP